MKSQIPSILEPESKWSKEPLRHVVRNLEEGELVQLVDDSVECHGSTQVPRTTPTERWHVTKALSKKLFETDFELVYVRAVKRDEPNTTKDKLQW